jgi:hypothetical protein
MGVKTIGVLNASNGIPNYRKGNTHFKSFVLHTLSRLFLMKEGTT